MPSLNTSLVRWMVNEINEPDTWPSEPSAVLHERSKARLPGASVLGPGYGVRASNLVADGLVEQRPAPAVLPVAELHPAQA